MKDLYHWVLKWAGHPRAFYVLCFISFIESSFFPIPVYPLLIAMSIQIPRKSLLYSLGAALSSVLGALLGYAIGYYFWDVTHTFFFTYIFSEEFFNLVASKYQGNTFVSVMIASITPVPFKVFTITGGAMHVPVLPFMLGALCGRSPRFIIIGLLFYFKGEKVRYWIEKHFTTFMYVVSAFVILGLIAYKLMR
jgi:membrane protein YqaA with SNARE-associated domain